MDGNIEIYDNEIELIIDEILEKNPDMDLYKSQSQWNYVLRQIYNRLFKPPVNMINNQSSILDYRNVLQVNYITDLYIDLCQKYKREISIKGWSNLTGINRQTLYNWKDNINNKDSNIYINNTSNRVQNNSSWNKATPTWFDIYKKLEESHEESLRNPLYDSNNVTGQIALANNDLGYSSPYKGETERSVLARISRNDVKNDISVNNTPMLPNTDSLE